MARAKRLAAGRYLRHLKAMNEAAITGRVPLSRRFCVAPMMERVC
jgi:hypothetical protein